MSLPFELYKDHKSKMQYVWKNRGMIFRDDGHFEFVYHEYIHATNCELCNKLFIKSYDRQLDHDHITGNVRNIVCNQCNLCKEDRVSNTNTGERFINKSKNNTYKTGYTFQIQISRNGKRVINTSRTTLEKAIICRDEFIKYNPDIYT